MIYPPYVDAPATQLIQVADEALDGARQRPWIEGTTIEGKEISRGVLLPLGDKADNGRARLAGAACAWCPWATSCR